MVATTFPSLKSGDLGAALVLSRPGASWVVVVQALPCTGPSQKLSPDQLSTWLFLPLELSLVPALKQGGIIVILSEFLENDHFLGWTIAGPKELVPLASLH